MPSLNKQLRILTIGHRTPARFEKPPHQARLIQSVRDIGRNLEERIRGVTRNAVNSSSKRKRRTKRIHDVAGRDIYGDRLSQSLYRYQEDDTHHHVSYHDGGDYWSSCGCAHGI
jgi:hypothetical protein